MSKQKVTDWFRGIFYKTLVEQSSDTKEAIDYVATFKPMPDYDYDWVIESALKESEYVQDAIQSMDSKADSLIGYIGAAEGVLGLATAYLAQEAGAGFVLVSGPTLILFLMAIAMALAVRAPAYLPGFPSARSAFKFAERDNGKTLYAAEVMVRSRASRVVIGKKGDLTRRAYLLFLLGIAWFAFAAIIYAFVKVLP